MLCAQVSPSKLAGSCPQHPADILYTVDEMTGQALPGGTDAAVDALVPVGLRHPRLVEVVATEIRTRILDGTWPQGTRLVETQVAAELGVSRNPVREAFRSLEADGFVELEPRKGARVALLSGEEAGHLFDVRGALEELAAGLAARHRSADHLATLRSILAAGSAAAVERLEELPALNTRFHDTLSAAASNPQLTAIMGPLRDRIQWVYAARVRERAPSSWAEHTAIVDAIEARDEVTARRLAGEHNARAKAAFLDGIAAR